MGLIRLFTLNKKNLITELSNIIINVKMIYADSKTKIAGYFPSRSLLNMTLDSQSKYRCCRGNGGGGWSPRQHTKFRCLLNNIFKKYINNQCLLIISLKM